MKNIQFKTFSFKFDDVSEANGRGMIKGYASIFNNVDLGFDVVEKGAFKKSIQESRGGIVPVLADHNPTKQIGWNRMAKEDDIGLYIEGELNLEVPEAKARYALAKQAIELGASAGLSIGYLTIKSEPDRERPIIRKLKELKLLEYSMVTFPMNTEAMVTACKSFDPGLDRAQLVLQQLQQNGITRDELVQALGVQAAKSSDPQKVLQSMDAIIASMRK